MADFQYLVLLAVAYILPFCVNGEDNSGLPIHNVHNSNYTTSKGYLTRLRKAFKQLDKQLQILKLSHFDYLSAQNLSLHSPFQGCVNRSHPPTGSKDIPTFEVNLDDIPEKRWSEVVKQKKTELKRLVAFFDQQFGKRFMQSVDKYISWFHKTLPQEYILELQGISKKSGINIGRVTLYNIFYEFFSVCTSIILAGKDGQMYHGRNLDFGLFMGWDVKNHTWALTEVLRPLIIKVEFVKKGVPLYSAITYAGYTGILTGVKKNAFSLTIDERFVLDGGYIGIAEWLLGGRHSSWLGLLTRQVFELAESYSQAKQVLVSSSLVAPVYFVLAAPKSQGCVITRGRNTSDVWELGGKHKGQKSGWYLLETNYDHWRNPPFYDKRGQYAVQCMEALGRSQPLDSLYSVLSTRPILNKETTLTALLQVSSGDLMVWERDCKDPCWPL